MFKNIKKISASVSIAALALAVFALAPASDTSAATCTTPSAGPCDLTINVNVADSISLAVTSGSEVSVELSVNDTWPSASHTTAATSTLAVTTNALSGYTLSVADYDTNNALRYIVSGTTVASIPAGSTSTPFNLSAGTPAWGIRGVSSGGTLDLSTTQFIGVPALSSAINWSTAFVPTGTNTVIYTNELSTKIGITPRTVSHHSNLSSAISNEQTVVEYGVATGGNQTAGTYTDTIVYMATVNV